jgi:hypothetical protein
MLVSPLIGNIDRQAQRFCLPLQESHFWSGNHDLAMNSVDEERLAAPGVLFQGRAALKSAVFVFAQTSVRSAAPPERLWGDRPMSFAHTTVAAYLEVITINLVLSGDNVVVIGMAATGLAKALRQKAIVAGIAAAAVIRVVLP